ncbi:hypothetical protein [Pikeienuella sp. HZG-20]|uniref:hypothetical protein n=1 Tax=Paludibacillus litoralis TaxID=3133267 RepID=UPI0030EBB7FA
MATFALTVAFSILEVGTSYMASGVLGFGQPAEARIGRPLTPVSIAGVGRRTARRCAAGIYNC